MEIPLREGSIDDRLDNIRADALPARCRSEEQAQLAGAIDGTDARKDKQTARLARKCFDQERYRVSPNQLIGEPFLDSASGRCARHGWSAVTPEAHQLGIVEPAMNELEVRTIDGAEVGEGAVNHWASTRLGRTAELGDLKPVSSGAPECIVPRRWCERGRRESFMHIDAKAAVRGCWPGRRRVLRRLARRSGHWSTRRSDRRYRQRRVPGPDYR